MALEIDLETIKHTAIEKTAENKSFQTYLNGQNLDQIDTLVQELNGYVTPNISCVDCGNCCRVMRPVATNEELSKFVKPENIEKYKYAENFTCMNLKDNKCSQYLDRPSECIEFPYIDRDKFITRTSGIIQNYAICPIVFNIFEQLKLKLSWVYNK